MEKSQAEYNVERATFGALLILFGVGWLVKLPSGVFPLIAAVILLGSAFYQRQQGWEVSGVTWFFGVVFAIAAAGDIVGDAFSYLGEFWFPILLIIIGVALLVRMYTERNR
ncbi:MAG: hypothetical protein Kow00120_09720 [Anaerolineae bacterium]